MAANCTYAGKTACGASAPQAAFSPWIKLVAGFVLIWALIFGAGSLAQLLPGAKRMAEVIAEIAQSRITERGATRADVGKQLECKGRREGAIDAVTHGARAFAG